MSATATKEKEKPEAEENRPTFKHLMSGVQGQMELTPGAKHLLLIKAGAMNDHDKALLLKMWAEKFGTAVIALTLEDPAESVRVLEIGE